MTLDPIDALATTSSDKSVVKFSNADGSAKVTVKASGDHMAIKAVAPLDKLLGDGTWSADVFGTGLAKVAYSIGKDGSGKPTVSLGAISAPGGVIATKLDPKAKTSGKFAWASAGVSFAHDGFIKRLSISVGTDTKDGAARLSIVLSGRDRQRLSGSLADLGGARVWAARLCDGTAVSVKYHVTTDGTVVYDGATGAPATAKDFKDLGAKKDPNKDAKPKASLDPKHHGWAGKDLVDGIVVRFDKTGVGVGVWLLKNTDGTYTLKVVGRSGHCGDGKHEHQPGHADSKHHHGQRGDGWRHDGRHHGHDSKPKSKP